MAVVAPPSAAPISRTGTGVAAVNTDTAATDLLDARGAAPVTPDPVGPTAIGPTEAGTKGIDPQAGWQHVTLPDGRETYIWYGADGSPHPEQQPEGTIGPSVDQQQTALRQIDAHYKAIQPTQTISGPGANPWAELAKTIGNGLGLNTLGTALGNLGKSAVDSIGIGGGGAIDSGALQGDIGASRSLAQQFDDAYKNFTPATAPTITAAQLGPQREAVASTVGAVPQVVAPTVGGPERVQAATVGGFQQAGGAGASGGVASAGTVGPIERAIAERATAQQLDPTQQAEFRENQKTLLGYLNDAINGTAPSVAELQLQQSQQRNAANQLGLAASASRGGNSALALRTAANNIGFINQKAAADAALLRAQEIATARGQYGDVANAGRTSDINIADRNATLGTDVSKTNATLGTQVNTSNAANDLSAKETQAKLITDASVATAGNQTQASVASANNATQASIANSNNSLAQQIAQAKLAQEASTTNATNATTLQQLQAQLLYNASHDNAGNALSAAETNAKLLSEASNTNANNATTLNVNQGQLTNAANINNAANAVTTAGQDITRQQNAADNTIKAQGQTIQGDANVLDNQTKKDVAETEAKGRIGAAVVGGFGSGVSTLVSDERAKTGIGDGEASAQDLLDHLTARTFRYRDEANGRGRQTGVMAQDVERSPAGRQFVRETSQGKALDPAKGFGTVLAMLATLNDRIERMEGARA